MPIKHLTAAVALALTCVLAGACLQTEAPGTDPGEAQRSTRAVRIGEAQQEADSNDSESIGEARQEAIATGRPFDSSDFPFVVRIKDDHKDKAGGWQVSRRHLDFREFGDNDPPYTWTCGVEIGMPLRSEKAGPISAFLAALYTANIANKVAWPLMESRETWVGQNAVYCRRLVDGMGLAFRQHYKGVGATVTLTR
jgi:hypothetical protein